MVSLHVAALCLQMVKMMIAVVLIYAVCWLPLHTITLVGESYDQIFSYRYIQPVWIACHWLAMSNCCYNPFVYCWMNARFRDGFRHVLRWLPCVRPRADGQFVKRSRVPTFVTTTTAAAGGGARSDRRAGCGGGGARGGLRGGLASSYTEPSEGSPRDNNYNDDDDGGGGHLLDVSQNDTEKIALRQFNNNRR